VSGDTPDETARPPSPRPESASLPENPALPDSPSLLQSSALADSPALPESPALPKSPPRAPGRRQWYLVAAITAGVAVLAGTGAALLTYARAPATRPLADDCGLVTCDAKLPASVTRLGVRSTAQAARPSPASHRRVHPISAVRAHSHPAAPAQPSQPAHPTPSRPSPPSRQPGPPHVTVTYTLDGGEWHQGFRAHLTIVNNGHRPVAGWTIQLTLPGDRVNWVGYQGPWQPFAAWRFGGGTLTLHAVSGGETLPPGGTEIVPLLAGGASTTPSGCSFNGSGCQP
jgi:hypothetical protein